MIIKLIDSSQAQNDSFVGVSELDNFPFSISHKKKRICKLGILAQRKVSVGLVNLTYNHIPPLLGGG